MLTTIVSFSSTIFLAAFLLFQVQPLISHYILPWFGGAPAVWSTAILFFQSMLLAGYAYAHWIASKSRQWIWLHFGLLFVSITLLLLSAFLWESPVLPGSTWKPEDSQEPIIRILVILQVSVGLPYFLLSSVSPLMQSWYTKLYPGQSTYHLYAISNLGALVGLVSYPFLVEPFFGLPAQSWIWSGGYLLFTMFSVYLGRKRLGAPLITAQKPQDTSSSNLSSRIGRIQSKKYHPLLWLALSACASILLLSVTNQLTQEIAVIPFLWVLPLSIYLLSFILTFSGKPFYPRLPVILLLAIVTLNIGYRTNMLTSTNILTQIVIFSLFLFLATLACHGELYQLRPAAENLTSFYLTVSAGGVIGGLFVNLLAPRIFLGYWELHVGILFCWLLILLMQWIIRPSILDSRWVGELIPGLLVILGLSGYLLARQINTSLTDVLEIHRNFFGVTRIEQIDLGQPPSTANKLKHGSTSHGIQFIEVEKQNLPTTYYGELSGVGLAMTHYRKIGSQDDSPKNQKVGVIGLGVGTLASYGQPGDTYRFYEINPYIIDLARGQGNYFRYLADSQAGIEIIPGDGRLSLESELKKQENQHFDILILDAFSSDAIPIHLLTMEAFGLYLEHLKPGGVLAVHISNRYLDLAPVVADLADQLHLEYALILSEQDDQIGSSAASWVLVSNNQAFFQILEKQGTNFSIIDQVSEIRTWTDDYYNLIPVIK